MKTIKGVLDAEFIHLTFNDKLGKMVSRYILEYTHSSKDNMEFFSSNLLGVIPVRYTDRQILKFFIDVLDVEFTDIQRVLREVNSINQSFKVTSDVFNIVLMYITHRFLTSDTLKDKLRIKYAKVTMSIFYYRTLAVLVAHGFKYNASKGIVELAFNNLSNKYIIKRLGTWNAVVDFRVSNVLDEDSKHYKTFLDFTDDDDALYIISDSQGSIKVLFKNYYSEIVKAKDNNESLLSISNVVTDVEGTDVFKDKIGGVSSLLNGVLHVVSDKDSFIKRPLLSVLSDLNKNADMDTVTSILEWMSDNSIGRYSKDVDSYIRNMIVYSFEYLSTQRPDIKTNDLPLLLLTLRNTYTSSRNNDPVFLDIKKAGDKIIKQAKMNKGSKNNLTSNRTALQLYIVLFSLTLNSD